MLTMKFLSINNSITEKSLNAFMEFKIQVVYAHIKFSPSLSRNHELYHLFECFKQQVTAHLSKKSMPLQIYAFQVQSRYTGSYSGKDISS